MSILVLLETSLSMIYRHAGRSILTILGMTIGITAIIVTFAIGRGAEMRIRAQIMGMGENAVFIVPGNVMKQGRQHDVNSPSKLTFTDLFAIKTQINEVSEGTPGFEISETIVNGTTSTKEQIMGVSPSLFVIRNIKTSRGMLFNEHHINQRANVIILGAKLAEILFKEEDPIGKVIRIKRIPFTVIGVLVAEETFFGTEDQSKRGYIPYTVAQKYFQKPNKTTQDVDFIALKLSNEKSAGEGLRKITRALRQTHHIKPNDDDDFTIFDQQSIAKSAATATEIVQLFGLIAASISLLVGGIGIMNIMLVSVQERTREIGLRLALGATQNLIQAQFLIEALTLCLLGGIFGILCGLGINELLGAFTSLPGVIETRPLLAALLITMLIGLSFGYYPARKASQLNPIDALYNL